MTKLNLSPDSKQLEKILHNKFLFEWYSTMLFEDYEIEMSRFEMVALFTNPEGFKKYKESQNKTLPKQMYRDGIEATKELEKLGILKQNQEEGIESIE